MSERQALQKYRELIDGLVARREGVLPRWIRDRGWPEVPENEEVNSLLGELSPEQKEVVARIAREARDGGIHDTLVYLQELQDKRQLRLVMDGVELPVSPYDTELFWDFTARAAGEAWPARPSEE